MNILSPNTDEEAKGITQEAPVAESANVTQVTSDTVNQTPSVAQNSDASPTTTAAEEPSPVAAVEPTPDSLQVRFQQAQEQLAQAQEQLKVFEELRAHPEFQKWYLSQSQPEALPEREAHIEELSDPAKYAARFQSELKRSLDAYHQEHVAPLIQQYQMQVERQAKVNAINAFASEHEDFWALADKGGPIDQIMTKYPEIAVEDAYNLAKSRTAQAEAIRKAHEVVAMKKQAVSEKPGASSGDRQGQITVHSDEEAMNVAMQYARKGQRPPRFIFADAK